MPQNITQTWHVSVSVLCSVLLRVCRLYYTVTITIGEFVREPLHGSFSIDRHSSSVDFTSVNRACLIFIIDMGPSNAERQPSKRRTTEKRNLEL